MYDSVDDVHAFDMQIWSFCSWGLWTSLLGDVVFLVLVVL